MAHWFTVWWRWGSFGCAATLGLALFGVGIEGAVAGEASLNLSIALLILGAASGGVAGVLFRRCLAVSRL